MEVGVGWSSSATAARPHVSYTRAWLDIGEVWGDMGSYGEMWGDVGRHGARLGLRGVEDVREAEGAQADAWRHGEHLGRYSEI